jgi:hypothetical protein
MNWANKTGAQKTATEFLFIMLVIRSHQDADCIGGWAARYQTRVQHDKCA